MTPAAGVLVPSRCCGPPTSGNGGWTSGALAALVDGVPDDHASTWPAVEVTLHAPPPLDVTLPVTTEGDRTVATVDDVRVASARLTDDAPRPVAVAPAEDARRASAAYAGFRAHPFPTCFACGPDRVEGDGLRIFPGPLAGDHAGRVAATWTPAVDLSEDWHHYADDHRRVSVPVTWASLDCAGAWAGGMAEQMMVLGRMTARLETLPVVGEEHVVVAEARGREGRKAWTATSLYDASGRLVGAAAQTWIAVDPATFAPRSG